MEKTTERKNFHQSYLGAVEMLREKIREETEPKKKDPILSFLKIFKGHHKEMGEIDKLFRPSKRLIRVFQQVLKNRKININVVNIPINEVITATSNDAG